MASRSKPLSKAQLESFINELDNEEDSDGSTDLNDGKKFSFILVLV